MSPSVWYASYIKPLIWSPQRICDFTFKIYCNAEASRCRLSYKRGLPHLVLLKLKTKIYIYILSLNVFLEREEEQKLSNFEKYLVKTVSN